jgi:hypothetical protein
MLVILDEEGWRKRLGEEPVTGEDGTTSRAYLRRWTPAAACACDGGPGWTQPIVTSP